MPVFGTSPSHYMWFGTSLTGLVSAGFTEAMHVFCWAGMGKLMFKPWLGLYSWEFGVYTLLFDLALLSHWRAMTVEPGVVPPGCLPPPTERDAYSDRSEMEEAGRWCTKCRHFKPPRAHHDSVSGRCVVKLDHWCPWTNNTVGLLNHKYFVLFCAYHAVACVYATVLAFSWVRFCATTGHLSPKVELAVMAFSELRADVWSELWHMVVVNLNASNFWSMILGPRVGAIRDDKRSADAASSSSSFSSSAGGAFVAQHVVSGEVWDPMSGWAEHEFGLLLFSQWHGDASGMECNNYESDLNNSSDSGSGSCSSNNSEEALAAMASLRSHEQSVCAGQGWLAMVLMLSHVAFGAFTVCMAIGEWRQMLYGETRIERLKGIRHEQPSKVNEPFGGGPLWQRVLPTAPYFPPDQTDTILGFTPQPTPSRIKPAQPVGSREPTAAADTAREKAEMLAQDKHLKSASAPGGFLSRAGAELQWLVLPGCVLAVNVLMIQFL